MPDQLPEVPQEIRDALAKIDKIVAGEIEPHLTDELRHYDKWHGLSAYARLLDGMFSLNRLTGRYE